MSIENDDNRFDINDANVETGYVADQEDNTLDNKEQHPENSDNKEQHPGEPKHFLQVLREAINEQIKDIEEEKKTATVETVNKQIHECRQCVSHSNLPEPVNNSASEKGISDGYEGFEIESA